MLAGLASFMVTLMFSSWIKFHQQHGRNAIVMTCVLAIGLVYIIGVNLRWWHTFIPAAQHKVRLQPACSLQSHHCHPALSSAVLIHFSPSFPVKAAHLQASWCLPVLLCRCLHGSPCTLPHPMQKRSNHQLAGTG